MKPRAESLTAESEKLSAKQSASLKSERQSISEDIEQRATAKYLDQKKELDRKFKAPDSEL